MQRSSAHSRPPGPSRLPVVGNTLDYLGDPTGFWERTAREYGPVAYYELGGDGFYQLSDPYLVERVLVHDNDTFRKGEIYQESLGPITGEGLLTSEGAFWRDQRHAIEPAFSPDRISEYADTMVSATERTTSEWTDGEVRDVHDEMMSLTVEIVADALFGVDVREFEAEVSDALEAVMDQVERRIERPIQPPEWVPTPGNRRYREALATIETTADAVIERANEADAAGASAGDPPGIVGLLRASDADASTEQLRDEVATLLLAGHETTALALTYALHLLGQHAAAAERLREEVDAVVGDTVPTKADVESMPFLEAVIDETMRVHPPVHEVFRETAAEVELGGYRIPEDETLVFQQWVLHRDPSVYAYPTSFRPERWLDGLKAEIPPFSYFPFGGGPRRCIGDRFALLEAKLALATIVRDWTVDPQGELTFAPSITLRPAGPVEMRLERRS